MCFVRFFLSLCLWSFTTRASAQIYADVQVAGGVTGSFTITLEHVKTPGAVANFIGLATGQRGWLDTTTGAIRYDNFYTGVTFHRVIAGFVSQTGSRNGQGTDGPGYKFRNEIDPTLTHVDYAVAMANSGLHTNGSQFYICKGPQAFLNGNYTVFGLVTSGQSVCDAINATPLSGSTPITPVRIQSVTIHGPSLAAFNRDPDWLPRLHNAKPTLTKAGASYTLGYEKLPYSEYTVWRTPNLSAWTQFSSRYFPSAAPSADIDVSATATTPSHFYRMARVDYTAAKNPHMPASLGGRTLTFSTSFLASSVVFNAAGTGGVWNVPNPPNTGTGTISVVTHTEAPFLPTLYMKWNSTANYNFDLEFLYVLNYTSPTAGTLTGQTNANGAGEITGTFTSSP